VHRRSECCELPLQFGFHQFPVFDKLLDVHHGVPYPRIAPGYSSSA
jgi:hypothetical protein